MTINRTTYTALFFLSLLWVLFIVVNYVSVYFSLFWYFWWLDIVMHGYGGVLMVASWFMVKSLGAFQRVMGLSDYYVLVLLCVVILGWELFEYGFGMVTSVDYAIDTVIDLAVGFGGGLASFLLLRSRTIETT